MCDQYQALKRLTEAQQRVKELEDKLHSAHFITLPRHYYAAAVEDSLKWIAFDIEQAKEQISKEK